jgi:hypothetical protein
VQIQYVASRSSVRGMKHEDDLPIALTRRNVDGSREVVARFHSSVYAEQLVKILNAEVSLSTANRAPALRSCNS